MRDGGRRNALNGRRHKWEAPPRDSHEEKKNEQKHPNAVRVHHRRRVGVKVIPADEEYAHLPPACVQHNDTAARATASPQRHDRRTRRTSDAGKSGPRFDC